eukprot:scaffold10680_cov118-Isochrysis_galbana.AAC.1
MDCAYISPKCWRPGGENHKGVVDFWRRKKQVFGAVQAVFRRHLLASTGIEEAEMREAEERIWRSAQAEPNVPQTEARTRCRCGCAAEGVGGRRPLSSVPRGLCGARACHGGIVPCHLRLS